MPGPLAPLSEQKYRTASFSYPLNLGLDAGMKHYVLFNVNESNNTNIKTNNLPGASFVDPGDIPRINDSGRSNFGNNRQSITRVSTAIALYMPPDISTTYETSWAQEDLGILGDATNALDTGNGSGILQALVSAGIRNAADEIGSHTDLNIIGVANNFYRAAYNPHAEVLFNGVKFRSFQFSFQMIPRSQIEAQVIDNIVKSFAFYSAAEINQTGGKFFLYPSEFDITFYMGNEENKYINKISTCALTQFSINYTGAGTWAAMVDGAPRQTNISLSFTELEIMHKGRISLGY
jgi:hypothetical protein